MAGANQQTRHVRHHQANEADRTGKGHRRAHQQRTERDQAATGAGHIQAEVLRLAANTPIANNGTTAATSAQLARASEPICQNTSDCSSLSLAM
ncbi:hypothetical protein G6F40_016671 [Rhizopus arrhizus]|nr:hypothetical protein G6F40_016671 [Rhizopus arrhizus]